MAQEFAKVLKCMTFILNTVFFYVIVDFAVFCDACLGRHPGYRWAFSGLFIQWYIEVRDI